LGSANRPFLTAGTALAVFATRREKSALQLAFVVTAADEKFKWIPEMEHFRAFGIVL